MSDLNVINATVLARIPDTGAAKRGREQGELGLVANGAVAIRDGTITAVGDTEAVMHDWGDPRVPCLDATGMTVLPGLIECHSHPLFSFRRYGEYARRLAGATLREIAAEGGGIWATVLSTRAASDADLLSGLRLAYRRVLRGGVTTLEVKSGYGLTQASELHQLQLLDESRALTPMSLVIAFLGAHVVPTDLDSTTYTAKVLEMLPAVIQQGIASFHDVTCETGLFSAAQASSLLERSRQLGLPSRVHADAWRSSEGWHTAVEGGAVSADHLTYTPDDEIRGVGTADTVAVLLPQAELVYMTDRRANARLFIDQEVPVALSTDFCSSIHASSLATTVGLAAPWFRMTPAEAIVGATLNAAYALRLASDRGSLDPGKRGDLTLLGVPHPDELCMAVGQEVISQVVIAGEPMLGAERPKSCEGKP